VTAPQTSDWPGREIPLASPVSPAFAPPLPPAGSAPVRAAQPTGSLAIWALTLALMAVALSGLGILVWMANIRMAVEQITGPNASQEEMQRVMQEEMLSGRIRLLTPANSVVFGVAILSGLAGLILSIQSLIRQESRRTTAILACVLSIFFSFCPMLPMLAALAASQAKLAPTAPASETEPAAAAPEDEPAMATSWLTAKPD